ncbi:MAG: hypothetical protein ACKPKO_22185, partial [Candidatus Fonsibacter sp.]
MKQRLLDHNGDLQARRQKRTLHTHHNGSMTDNKQAKQIITKARKNALGKAIKTFTPNITDLSDQQKKDCVPIYLPERQTPPHPINERQIATAAALSPAGQTLSQIKQFLYEKHHTTGRHKTMARIHFKRLCAPGPSGQRGEHAEQIYKLKHETLKTRWNRAIDELTARAMQGTLPQCCEWILHTSLTWLNKTTQQEADDLEDARWTLLWK